MPVRILKTRSLAWGALSLALTLVVLFLVRACNTENRSREIMRVTHTLKTFFMATGRYPRDWDDIAGVCGATAADARQDFVIEFDAFNADLTRYLSSQAALPESDRFLDAVPVVLRERYPSRLWYRHDRDRFEQLWNSVWMRELLYLDHWQDFGHDRIANPREAG